MFHRSRRSIHIPCSTDLGELFILGRSIGSIGSRVLSSGTLEEIEEQRSSFGELSSSQFIDREFAPSAAPL